MKISSHGYDLAILIVLYKCRISDSETFESIINSSHFFFGKKVRVCIWNNGPSSDSSYEFSISKLNSIDGISAVYIEDIGNSPLSWIYNYFLDSTAADAYVFLDNDSVLNADVLNNMFAFSNSDVDIFVPHVMAQSKIHGPICNKAIKNDDFTICLSGHDRFFSISSGITLYKSGLLKIKRNFDEIFDKNFALYGVDTSFWLRIFEISKGIKVKVVCKSNIMHSLSRLEKESPQVTKFRRKERGLDFGITLRRYPSIRRYFIFLKFILIRILRKDSILGGIPSIYWTIRGFFAGRHPRCKEEFSPSEWK